MEHVKDFQSFIFESETNETLHEASHAGRAWSGKIENVDKLLSWMYDKGILNKSEQKEKDSRFRQYYRWYNDGDFPTGLRSRGISPSMKEEVIETALEQYIEEFIKKVLAKYTGKYDRKDFRIDTLLGDLYTLQGVIEEPNPHGLLTYWGKKINVNDSEFEKMLGELSSIYADAKAAADDIVDKEIAGGIYKDEKSYNIPGKGTTIKYQRDRLQDAKVWTPDAEKKYWKMADHMKGMNDILKNVIEAAQQLKQQTGV